MIKNNKKWENGVLEVTNQEIHDFTMKFVDTLGSKLKQKGCFTFNSAQEVMGKLLEEVLEAQDEAHNRNLENLKSELLDVAIVAFWGYVSANKWKKIDKTE